MTHPGHRETPLCSCHDQWTGDPATDRAALVARALETLPDLPPRLSGPTCPVCWPGKTLTPTLADWHRTWHTLRSGMLRAQASLDQTGSDYDRRRVARTSDALTAFEARPTPD